MLHRSLRRALLTALTVVAMDCLLAQVGDHRLCLDSCKALESRGDLRNAVVYAERAVALARSAQDSLAVGHALLQAGLLHQRLGNFDAALERYLSAWNEFEALNDLEGQADALNDIGAVHHYDKNYTTAGEYYARSMAVRRRLGDPAKLALPYNNLGSLLEASGRPDSALHYYRLALVIRKAQNDNPWVGILHSHIGSCHDRLGNMDSALYYMQLAERTIAEYGSPSLKGSTKRMLGLTYLHAGRTAEAVRWCNAALDAAHALSDPYLEQESCECLHLAYAQLGRHADAYAMFTRYMALRDSMFGAERAKERTRIDLMHQFERQQLADSLVSLERQRRADLDYQERIRRERDQKRLYLYGGLAVLLVAGGLWNRLVFTRRSRNLVQRERERSDQLLLNILPAAIAEELKEHGRAKAREVEGVSILFTDFHDFTRFSERMDAQELVGEIDACFKAFDAVCARHGLEKIKTIGDAYMAAGGLPEPWPGSTIATVRAAVEMQQWLDLRASERDALGLPAFRMRSGIHTGPVVAGIVGDAKFQYDVWGDTVNIAARMESSSAVGRVNISASTYDRIKDEAGLHFTPRGEVQAKGKGAMAMYFVDPVPA